MGTNVLVALQTLVETVTLSVGIGTEYGIEPTGLSCSLPSLVPILCA